LYKGFIFLLFGGLFAACASERHAGVSWQGDNVRVVIVPEGGSTLFSSPSIECLSCDQVLPPIPLDEDHQGVAYFKLEEAAQRVATIFRIRAAGLDTAVFLQPRPEPEANRYYKPSQPIIGRILATTLGHIYKDSTMAFSIGTLARGAEANLFRENSVFYFIHHPMYDHPVVVLRSNAVRLR
jgi:hypothetical protein